MPNKTKANFQQDATELIEYAFSEVGSIPGISMSVVKDGKSVFEKGFGYANIETKLKMKENTSFYIASCTKAFTALLAAVLDKEGVISLEASLASFFPQIKFDAALKADEVSVKSLLTHTSGLSNGPIGFRVAYSGEQTHEQLVKLLSASKPNKAGKGNYQYTNVGYNIYALIVQEVIGESWQQLLQTKIFQPLGMKRTTAFMSKAEKGNWPMALPYIGLDRDQYQAVYLLKKDNTMQSAGGLITTATDLGRWVNMHCMATPYTKPNTARVELVPGSGEVLLFEMEGDKIVGIISDGDLFRKVD